MDLNSDGVVTLEEFHESCCTDETICRSLAAFDCSFWPEIKSPQSGDLTDTTKHNQRRLQLSKGGRKSSVHFEGEQQEEEAVSYYKLTNEMEGDRRGSSSQSPSLVRVRSYFIAKPERFTRRLHSQNAS